MPAAAAAAARVSGGIHEKIFESLPGESITYRIVRGAFPATEHEGHITFEALPGATEVRLVGDWALPDGV